MKKLIITEEERIRILGLHKYLMVEQPVANPDEYQANTAIDDLSKPISTKGGVMNLAPNKQTLIDVTQLELLGLNGVKTTVDKGGEHLECKAQYYKKIGEYGGIDIDLLFYIPRVGGQESTLINPKIRTDIYAILSEISKKNYDILTGLTGKDTNVDYRWFKSIMEVILTGNYHFYIKMGFTNEDSTELELFRQNFATNIMVYVFTISEKVPQFVKERYGRDKILILNDDYTTGLDGVTYKIEDNLLVFQDNMKPPTTIQQTSTPQTTTGQQTSTTQNTSGTSTEKTNTNYDRAFDYMLKDGKYYFKGKPNTSYGKKYPNWVEAKGTSATEIQNKVFK